MNAKFYLVGGAVRDEILGVKSKDFDYSVEAPSYQDMVNAIIERGGQIFLETPKFFTVRAKVPRLGAADFVLCRKERDYTDNRHPDTVEVGTLYDDLSRRDFTMNAIAKDENGNYVDPFNGIKDVKNGIIKCVGNPLDRFKEDALRMLRALRFSVTKRMLLDGDIHYILKDNLIVNNLLNISVERIREELYKMFMFDTFASMRLLQKYDCVFNVLFYLDRRGLKLIPTLKV